MSHLILRCRDIEFAGPSAENEQREVLSRKTIIAMNNKVSIRKKRVKLLNTAMNIIEVRAARNIRQILAYVPLNNAQS